MAQAGEPEQGLEQTKWNALHTGLLGSAPRQGRGTSHRRQNCFPYLTSHGKLGKVHKKFRLSGNFFVAVQFTYGYSFVACWHGIVTHYGMEPPPQSGKLAP